MALGTTAALAIGLGAAGAGSFMNARQQNQAAKRASVYGAEQAQWMRSLMGGGPSAAERWGIDFLQSQPNAGQDPIMQTLRVDPAQRSSETLRALIADGGGMTDVRNLLGTLGVLDQRVLEETLATGRAAAPGLGQRYGSAQMREDSRVRERSAETSSARNAGIMTQAMEGAQQRVLSALGLLNQQEQFGTQTEIAQNQFDTQMQIADRQLGQQDMQMLAGIFQALMGAQTARRGQDMGFAQLASGVGAPVEGPGYGNVLGSLGQLLLLSSMSGQGGTASTATAVPSYGPWNLGGYRVPAYVPQLSPTTVPPNLNPVY